MIKATKSTNNQTKGKFKTKIKHFFKVTLKNFFTVKLKHFFKVTLKEFFKKNAKYFWAAAYFVLAVSLSVSIYYTISKNTYVRIFVSGQSMSPTLNGGSSGGAKVGDTVDFGYMDSTSGAIDNAKRFNVVITYFPNSWGTTDYIDDAETKLSSSASYKIKRLIAFPNETLTIATENNVQKMTITGKDNAYEYTYTYQDPVKNDEDSSQKGYWLGDNGHHYEYEINKAYKDFTVTLGEGEYFVMGDNWLGSSDSSTHIGRGNIKRHNLQGVLVAIEGTAKVIQDKSGSRNISDLTYKNKKYYYTEL